MSSATEGVKPDVRELGVSVLGNRKRRLGGPLGVVGVLGRRVAPSRTAENKGDEISSGRGVRLETEDNMEEGGGAVEDITRDDTASEWDTSRFTGPSRPSEMTFVVELLFPRSIPSNSTSRELRPLGT